MVTIGIVNRIDKTLNNNVYVFNKEIIDYLLNNNVRIIPLISYDIDLIKQCNGFILPGGDDKTIDFKIIKYAYELDIPLLGICLGMQSIGEYFNGTLINVDNHYSKDNYVHEINILKSSKIYNILKQEKIKVNSRHKMKLINTDIFISAKATDGTIEVIEDKYKRFFVGVEWHPESMITYDLNSKKLLDSFIKSCKEEKH